MVQIISKFRFLHLGSPFCIGLSSYITKVDKYGQTVKKYFIICDI